MDNSNNIPENINKEEFPFFDNPLWRRTEVALFLGVSQRTVRRYENKGVIRRINQPGIICLYDREEVFKFIKGGTDREDR